MRPEQGKLLFTVVNETTELLSIPHAESRAGFFYVGNIYGYSWPYQPVRECLLAGEGL